MLTHRRYEPREVLGRGAQGVVLRVVDREAPARALVAKVLSAKLAGEPLLAAEFALLSRLRSRGVVRAHDFGRDERTGTPFFVEDFAPGVDALEYVQSARESSGRSARIVEVVAGTAAALAGLHAAGFVHGDLKPAHVRVGPDGPVLVDLGCAVLHGRAAAGVTRAFAAPEAVALGEMGPRADLFSLGKLTYALRAAGVLPASIEALAKALVAEHPADRPASAHDVLAALGLARGGLGVGARVPPIGRERDLAWMLARGDRVKVITGGPGSGKSHALEEACLAALVDGGSARVVAWRTDAALVPKLVAYLRGDRDAWPYSPTPKGTRVTLLVDDVDRAPSELAGALLAFRCGDQRTDVEVIASASRALAGIPARELEPLSPPDFRALCEAVGVADVALAERATGRQPGLLVAMAGRVPLTREAILARTRSLDEREALLLAGLALLGGRAHLDFVRALLGDRAESSLAGLVSAGLLARDAAGYSLFAATLASDVAAALGSCAIVDRVADALSSLDAPDPSALLRLAHAPYPPTERDHLLRRAASRARDERLASVETDALLELAKAPQTRDETVLTRLERLLRDAGRATEHATVIEWMATLEGASPKARVLTLRRGAERAARTGDRREALALVGEATREAGDDAALLSLVRATLGAVHLYASDATEAREALEAARVVLAHACADDPEELARLDHNLGVASLVAFDLDAAIAALSRSLTTKRALGDLAGTRSCLLNLGIAHAKAGEFDLAKRALDEALSLARSLGQRAGAAWCLVALADLEARRGDPSSARAFAAEAELSIDALPAPVRADLTLALATADVLEGQGAVAIRSVSALDAALRRDDALLDARAWLVTGRAHLATLPADRRAAARAAIAALARAKVADLKEIVRPATELLRSARSARVKKEETKMASTVDPYAALWDAAARMSLASSEEQAAQAVLATVLEVSKAERAFAVVLREEVAARAFGRDTDGLPVANALERAGKLAPREAGVSYHRDVEMGGARGSRLLARHGDVALVVEHRFIVGAFDTVAETFFARAAVLASLGARTPGAGALAPASPPQAHEARSASADTTVLPSREARRSFPEIRGGSRALLHALARLDAAIDTDLPVLVSGETGTGKELFARALHEHGARKNGPFVAVNCAAIPESLLEAELFGHVKGAFTGADRARPGLLARAEGGTLLLDEVGDLALARQASLLRVLESRRFRPVGADDEHAFDVRVVSATHRDLDAMVKAGTFRSDLLYRLRVLEVRVPPLAARDGDVELLARHFLDAAGSRTELSPRALAALVDYAWPGNVRELAHLMARLVALRIAKIELLHLPREIRAAPPRARAPVDERALVERALAQTGGNISHAAASLGITRHGLKKRMLRLKMRSSS